MLKPLELSFFPKEIIHSIFYFLDKADLHICFRLNHLYLNLLQELFYCSILQSTSVFYHEKIYAKASLLKENRRGFQAISDPIFEELIECMLSRERNPNDHYHDLEEYLSAIAPLLTSTQAKFFFICNLNKILEMQQSLLFIPGNRYHGVYNALHTIGKMISKKDANQLIHEYGVNDNCKIILLFSIGEQLENDFKIPALEKIIAVYRRHLGLQRENYFAFNESAMNGCIADLAFLMDKKMAATLIEELIENIDLHIKNIREFGAVENDWVDGELGYFNNLSRMFKNLSWQLGEDKLSGIISLLEAGLSEEYSLKLELYLEFLSAFKKLPANIAIKMRDKLTEYFYTDFKYTSKWEHQSERDEHLCRRISKYMTKVANSLTEDQIYTWTQSILKSFVLEKINDHAMFIDIIFPKISMMFIEDLALSYLGLLTTELYEKNNKSLSSLVNMLEPVMSISLAKKMQAYLIKLSDNNPMMKDSIETIIEEWPYRISKDTELFNFLKAHNFIDSSLSNDEFDLQKQVNGIHTYLVNTNLLTSTHNVNIITEGLELLRHHSALIATTSIPYLLKLLSYDVKDEKIIRDQTKLRIRAMNLISDLICLKKIPYNYYPLFFDGAKTNQQLIMGSFFKLHLRLKNPMGYMFCLNVDYHQSKGRMFSYSYISRKSHAIANYADKEATAFFEELDKKEQQSFQNQISFFRMFEENHLHQTTDGTKDESKNSCVLF